MKTSNKIAALLATLATTVAVGCAAHSDATDSPEVAQAAVAHEADSHEADAPVADEAVAAYDFEGKSFKGDIAKMILEKLANAGFDLFLNKVGLGNTTPAQLDRIIQQLEEIDRELKETRQEMNSALVKNALDVKLMNTHNTLLAINETLRKYTKIIELTETVEVSRMTGDQAALDAANFALEDAVREFVWSFDIDGVMNRSIGLLNLTIVGSPGGEQNLIDLYRWKLRAEGGRFLTAKHTESLHAGYTYFEDLQAMATFLQAECNAAVRFGKYGTGKWQTVESRGCSIDQRENDHLAAQLERMTAEQRQRLPTPIPPGVLIDQVANYGGTNGNTHNKPMFMTVDGTYRWAPSDNANTAGSVPQKLTENHAGGDAWRMPTDAELAPLFAGARGNLGEHLNGRFATTGRFSGQPFIWTSNRVNQNMNYDRANRGDYEEVWYITVSTQKGYVVDQNGTRSIGQPVMAHDYTLKTRQNAEARRDHNFATLRGGIILTRNTLGTDYM